MSSAKEIKRRIRSISNTKQIISAMELVSVVKMQKAVTNNLSSRNFSKFTEELLNDLCKNISQKAHPYLQTPPGDKKLVILITSDRGLCGGLNIKLVKQAVEEAKEGQVSFVAVGKKGKDFLSCYGYDILAEFSGFGDNPEFKNIIPIIQLVSEEFLKGNYNQVKVIYTHFESSLTQVTKVASLLPFSFGTSDKEEDIIFEPSKDEILESLIPRVLETKLWQLFLESVASEHSARMMAMKNANENAEDLIFDLTLSFNQTRQAGITREIAEISAGKMTLEG